MAKMTVSDLRELLLLLPPDAEVFFNRIDYEYHYELEEPTLQLIDVGKEHPTTGLVPNPKPKANALEVRKALVIGTTNSSGMT